MFYVGIVVLSIGGGANQWLGALWFGICNYLAKQKHLGQNKGARPIRSSVANRVYVGATKIFDIS